jgi:hypothetical protein
MYEAKKLYGSFIDGMGGYFTVSFVYLAVGISAYIMGGGLFPHGDYEKLAEEINKLLYNKEYYEQVKNKCMERSGMYDIKTMVNHI